MSTRRIVLTGGLVFTGVLTVVAIQRIGRYASKDPDTDAIAAIKEKGGTVGREGNSPESPVVAIRMSGRRVTDADLEMLAAFPDLQELHLQGSGVTDDGLKHLHPLRRLRLLNLQGTAITDAGLAELKDHSELEGLMLYLTQVTDGGLEQLALLRKLRVLQVPATCMTPRGFRIFRYHGLVKDFPGLLDAEGQRATRPEDIHTLRFPPTSTSTELLAGWLAEMPTLRVLHVDSHLVTDDLLRELSRLGKLHMLRVNVWSESNQSFFPLLTKSERERFDAERPDRDEDIIHLVLYGCPISDVSLDTLLTLKKLRWLELDKTRVTAKGLVRLATLPELDRLDASNVRMTAADLLPFRSHKKLTLDVDFELSDASLKACREGRTLHLLCSLPDDEDNSRALSLAKSSVTDAGLTELKDFHDFSSLSLSETKVSDAGLARLTDHPQLKGLFLNGTPLTDAGLKHLTGLPKLEQLDLENTAITDTGLEHLAGLVSLENLDLRGTRVSGTGLKHLAGLPKLEKLNLRNTPISDAGLKGLPSLAALRKLDLRDTEVTDAGLVELKRLTKLKELDLWDTRVTEAGIENLKAALPDCRISGRAKRDPPLTPPMGAPK